MSYDIAFTQTWLAHDPAEPGYSWLGPRLLTGQLNIDDSVLGPAHANSTYGPSSPELAAIYSYTVTLDGKVYQFDRPYTQAVVAPPFTTVIRTDANGVIVDLQGMFRFPGSISTVVLGRQGWEGTYYDLQQTDPFSNVSVSSGTYVVALSAVPEPQTFALMSMGLIAAVGAIGRKRNRRPT
ncbi:MAG: PEP-CTERM sorting domain-containing protein [Burkholderiaceae bacterium]|nr:PEP-CTERM sorting domain-containing protein [Burkholderiaceae bacterium]